MSRLPKTRAAALLARACLVSTLAALSTGCEAKITEVIVVVDTDLRIPLDIDAIDVRVNTAGRMLPGLDAPLTGSVRNSLPLSLGLRSESDSDTAFNVVARGLQRGSEVLRSEVSTRFVPGERRVLRIRLTANCLDVVCTSGTTCRDGECRPRDIDPKLLPPLSELDLGVDAPINDAGVDGDAAGDGGDAGPDDLGTDGGGVCTASDGGVVGAPPGCVPARPTPRPACVDDGSTVGATSFALRDVVIDQAGDRWRTLGWDLDGNCTDALAATPVTECTPPAAPAPTDGLNGIDNAFGGQIASQFIAYQPDLATATSGALAEGRNAPVVTIEGWNGEPDDPRVEVTLAYAVDLLPAGTAVPATGLRVRNGLPDPNWDGTDTAYLSSASFGGDGVGILYDDNAYIAGGLIVARLPDRAEVNLPGGLGTVRVRLTDVRFTAHVNATGDALTDALITGRWSRSDMLMFLDDIGVCPGTPTTDLARTGFDVLLLRAMDVRGTPGTGGPGVNCDAISAAIPFENGVPVTVGDTIEVTLDPFACP